VSHGPAHAVPGEGSQLLGDLDAAQQGGSRIIAVQDIVEDVAHLGGIPPLVPIRWSLALDHVRSQFPQAVVRLLESCASLPVAAIAALTDFRLEVAETIL